MPRPPARLARSAPGNAVGVMDNPEPKKPFTEPKLVVYGDIQQITHSVGKVGALDAAGMAAMGNPMGGAIRTR